MPTEGQINEVHANQQSAIGGVAHDQLDTYMIHRYETYRDIDLTAMFPMMPVEHAMVMRALYRHGEDVRRQYSTLVMETNAPLEQLVIVCPLAEVGPVAATVRWQGMPLRPEHSATEWRVVWERPTLGGQG